MSDVSKLHAQATRLILHLRDGLEKLEKGLGSQPREQLSRQGEQLWATALQLQRLSAELQGSWRLQAIRESSNKRDVWRRKVEHVVDESSMLQSGLSRALTRLRAAQQEASDREELLSRAVVGRQVKNQMDAEAQMAGSVQRSKGQLQEMFDSGAEILLGMSSNRERLKRSHRKVLDVINSLGLGESVLRVIERRQRMDAHIVYGGMIFTLIFTAGLIWWRLF